MKQEERSTLRAVREALDQVEVHGSRNLDMLLGCMQALDRVLAAAEEAEVSDG